MSTEVIFFTQVASIVAFVGAVFGLYRLLVAQKDSVIELLKERNVLLEKRVAELDAQTSDALVSALSARIQAAIQEIERLKEDGEKHRDTITEKEGALETLQDQLSQVMQMIRDTDLVCPECSSPLSERVCYPVYGHINGHEVDADAEFLAYECGRQVRDGEVVSACGSAALWRAGIPAP